MPMDWLLVGCKLQSQCDWHYKLAVSVGLVVARRAQHYGSATSNSIAPIRLLGIGLTVAESCTKCLAVSNRGVIPAVVLLQSIITLHLTAIVIGTDWSSVSAMGLLGGEETLTSGASGWGVPPPSSSSPAWGSTSVNWATSRQTVTTEQNISTSPKVINSWAQAAGKGLNNGPSHDLCGAVANNGFQNDNSTKNYRNDFGEVKEAALCDNWGHSVSVNLSN